MPDFEWGKDSTPVFEWGKDSTPVGPPPKADLFKAASDALPSALGTINAGVRGALDMVPFSHKFIAGVQGEPVADVDARYEAEKEANPVAFRTGQAAGVLALPVPKGAAGMAALGAAQAAGDSRGDVADMLEKAGIGGVIGGAAGLAGKAIGAVSGKTIPWLQQLEDKYAGRVATGYAKSAQDAARSAAGGYGSAVQQGSRGIKNLGELAGKTGDAATEAAIQSTLGAPETQAVAKQVAESTMDKLPGAIDQITASKALADQTAKDALQAYADGKLPEVAWDRLKSRAGDQVRRYMYPAAAGAALGYVTGDDEHRGSRAMEYGVVGAAANRSVRAVARLAVSPEALRLITRKGLSSAQKLSQLAVSQPQAVGKFALALRKAASEGSDAVAVTHFALSADPDYQALAHEAEGDPK